MKSIAYDASYAWYLAHTVLKIDTTPLITHRYKLDDIEEAYHIFENRLDGVIKMAIET